MLRKRKGNKDAPKRLELSWVQTMKVSYFDDTDTLYIEFRSMDFPRYRGKSSSDIAESKDLDENTILDLDAKGNVCAITFEHASQRTDVSHLIVA